jgi:hypothetical protein
MAVAVSVIGVEGQALLIALGVPQDRVKVFEPIDGPETFTADVQPFALMTEPEYEKWVRELLRQKLGEHWGHRW